MSVFN